VPVVLVGRDQDDVALRNRLLLVIGGDRAGAFGDHQNLVAGVLVELVARAGAEVDDAKVKGLAIAWLEDDLPIDVPGKKRAVRRLLGQAAHLLDDLHGASSPLRMY